MRKLTFFLAAAFAATIQGFAQERPLDMKMDFEEYDPPTSLKVEEHRLTR